MESVLLYVQTQQLHSITLMKQQNLVFKIVLITISKMTSLEDVYSLVDVLMGIMLITHKENAY